MEDKHVKEFKRKCNQCGKVWHSLEAREKEIESSVKTNSLMQATQCCNAGAQLQAKRNADASVSELDKLKSCPNCGSKDYEEKIITYKKK